MDKQTLIKLSSNLYVIVASILFGATVGLLSPAIGESLAPYGQVFITYLSMCATPIMMAAVVLSFGRLLSHSSSSGYLTGLFTMFVAGLLMCSLAALLMSLVLMPGDLTVEAKSQLGTILTESEATTTYSTSQDLSMIPTVLTMMVPANIFDALSEGRSLQILFFSIILGLMVGLLPKEESDSFLKMVDTVFQALQNAIAYGIRLLPLGLFCIFAYQVTQTGLPVLWASAKLVMTIYLSCMIAMLLAGVVIAACQKTSVWTSFDRLRHPLVVGFGTANSLGVIPLVITALKERYAIDEVSVNLVVPLNMVVCRYGVVILFVTCSLFLSQLFAIPLTVGQMLFVIVGSIFATLAGAGANIFVVISLIDIVLLPLGLPFGMAMVVILAVLPIIDPIVTVTTVYLSAVATILIAMRMNKEAGYAMPNSSTRRSM